MDCIAKIQHPQADFFVCELVDVSFKSDQVSLEHPIFVLRAGDRKIRTYEHNGNTIEIRPGTKHGLATMHDKDVWIYCISHLIHAMNNGNKNLSKTVRFVAYDFLLHTNRQTGGDAYQRLTESLERLAETRIVTNIETGGRKEREGFGLIDRWKILQCEASNRMIAVEVDLPSWLWRSIQDVKKVLTYNSKYFQIRKPLDRRIYEIARKHCGRQPSFKISLEALYKKSGSTAPLKKFRMQIKRLGRTTEFPDYTIEFDELTQMVCFFSRIPDGYKLRIKYIQRKSRKTLYAKIQKPVN